MVYAGTELVFRPTAPIDLQAGESRKPTRVFWSVFIALSLLLHACLLGLEISIAPFGIHTKPRERVLRLYLQPSQLVTAEPTPKVAQPQAKEKPENHRRTERKDRTASEQANHRKIPVSASLSIRPANEPIFKPPGRLAKPDIRQQVLQQVISENDSGDRFFNPNLNTRQQLLESRIPGVLDVPDTEQVEFARETGHFGDYIGLRMHGKCWRVPVRKDAEQFDYRIWMQDMNCPPEKRLSLFFNKK